jgi:erythromycin esterase
VNLSALLEIAGDARVVAIGETAHHVPAYLRLRRDIIEILVQKAGFTVVAMESGFPEGLALDAWLAGAPGPFPASALTYDFGSQAETRSLFAWLRSCGGIRYHGVDLPGGLASPLPALDIVAAYLASADPGHSLAEIRHLASMYAGPDTIPAFTAYRAMSRPDRDQLTVLLASLAARFDALRPLYPPSGWATARHALRLAVLLDQQLRAQLAGDLAVNVRDHAMASTMSELLAEDDARVILIAANSHIQRVPVVAGPYRFPVLGQHLSASLGSAYFAIGMTALAGRTVTRRPAPDLPAGFETAEADLPPAPPDTAEATLGPGLHRLNPSAAAGTRLRTLDTFTQLPVAAAFDALACLAVTEP